ncbi:hypothetical protein AAC387_Pa02g0787 [Persea americana]
MKRSRSDPSARYKPGLVVGDVEDGEAGESLPMSAGMGPERRFPTRSRMLRAEREVMQEGMVPEMLF